MNLLASLVELWGRWLDIETNKERIIELLTRLQEADETDVPALAAELRKLLRKHFRLLRKLAVEILLAEFSGPEIGR